MNDSESKETPSSNSYLKQADYLWKEYEYRHDLVWRLIFRLTTAVVILAVIPYIKEEITARLAGSILIVPFLAFALALFGVLVMMNELELLGRIKAKYRELQNKLFREDLHDPLVKEELTLFGTLKNEIKKLVSRSYRERIGETYGSFNQLVLFYLIVLAGLSLLNIAFTYFFWIR
jgi:hypothetical protein